ncbi:MAG: ribonuclease R, partial [Patescibacteria group bacterium]
MQEAKENPYIGIIRVTGKGVGYFPIPDSDEDFEIPPEEINTALNRDTVRIEDLKRVSPYGRKMAKVVEIIERKKTEFVGTFDKNFIIPDDKRMYRDIAVTDAQGAKDG